MSSIRYLLILTLGLTCTAALAQSTTQPAQPARPFAGGGAFGGGNGGGGGGGRGEMFIQRVRDQLTDLNLTDDQNKKINAILDKAKDDMRALGQQLQNMQPQERQEKIRDFLTDTRDKIKAELTPDQADKFQQKIDALRQRGGGGGRFGGGANGGANGTANNNASTTQPTNSPQANGQQAPQGPQRLDAIVQRLNDSLAALNLTGDQKSQVGKVLDQTKTQLQDLRAKVRNGGASPDDMRSQAQDILSNTRDQLAGILTKDQQEQLRDEIQKRVNETGPATRPSSPSTKPVVMADPTMQQQDKMQDKAMATGSSAMADGSSADKSSGGASAKGSTPAAFLVSSGPKVGDPAPAFTLNKLDGRPVQLSFFKGRPLVIEFGSYTSPTFREQASKMEELARQYNGRAAFLVVYTKEAHPQGGWEVDRNHDDRISLAQPADLPARNAAAKDAKLALKITIPIAIDTMDNTLATAIGAGENSAVVIGKDGSIVARQAWCDPFRLRIELDQAISNSVAIAH